MIIDQRLDPAADIALLRVGLDLIECGIERAARRQIDLAALGGGGDLATDLGFQRIECRRTEVVDVLAEDVADRAVDLGRLLNS